MTKQINDLYEQVEQTHTEKETFSSLRDHELRAIPKRIEVCLLEVASSRYSVSLSQHEKQPRSQGLSSCRPLEGARRDPGLSTLALWGDKMRDPGNEVAREKRQRAKKERDAYKSVILEIFRDSLDS